MTFALTPPINNAENCRKPPKIAIIEKTIEMLKKI